MFVAVYGLKETAAPPLVQVEWSEVGEVARSDYFLIVLGVITAALQLACHLTPGVIYIIDDVIVLSVRIVNVIVIIVLMLVVRCALCRRTQTSAIVTTVVAAVVTAVVAAVVATMVSTVVAAVVATVVTAVVAVVAVVTVAIVPLAAHVWQRARTAVHIARSHIVTIHVSK